MPFHEAGLQYIEEEVPRTIAMASSSDAGDVCAAVGAATSIKCFRISRSNVALPDEDALDGATGPQQLHFATVDVAAPAPVIASTFMSANASPLDGDTLVTMHEDHPDMGVLSFGEGAVDNTLTTFAVTDRPTAAMSLAVLEGAPHVAVATKDGTVLVADVGSETTALPETRVRGTAGLPLSGALCPEPGRLLAACHHSLMLIDLRAGASVVQRWNWAPSERITAHDVAGHRIAAATDAGTVLLWDARHGAPQDTNGRRTAATPSVERGVAEAQSPVVSLRWLDGERFVTGSRNTSLRLWEAGPHTLLGSSRFFPPNAAAMPAVPVMGAGGQLQAMAADPATGMVGAADDTGLLHFFVHGA